MRRLRIILVGLACSSSACSEAERYVLSLPLRFRQNEYQESVDQKRLLWFLCSSKDWRVSDASGALVAVPRDSAAMAGFEATDSTICAISIRFTPYKTASPVWLLEGNFTPAHRQDSDVAVVLESTLDSGGQRTFASRLVLEIEKDLWIEIYERSALRERHGTSAALEWSLSILANSTETESALREALAHNGSLRRRNGGSAAPVAQAAIDHLGNGQYRLHGFMNPLIRGFVETEIVDSGTGTSRNEQKRVRTREWTGWSQDPEDIFYFDAPVVVDGDGSVEDLRVHVVFTPVQSSVIFSTNCLLETWTR